MHHTQRNDNPPAAILKQPMEVHLNQKRILHYHNRLLHDERSPPERGLPERNDDLSLLTTYCILLFHLSAETVGGIVLDEPSTVARRRGRGHRRPAALRPLDPKLAVDRKSTRLNSSH